jgi:hypothetical protein
MFGRAFAAVTQELRNQVSNIYLRFLYLQPTFLSKGKKVGVHAVFVPPPSKFNL